MLGFTALSALHSKTVVAMKLKSRQNLQSPQSRFELKLQFYLHVFIRQTFLNCMHDTSSLFSSRATILVELEMDGNTEPLNFVPGDHVGVFPGNSPELVAGILKHLPNAPPINQSLRLEFLSDSYPGTEPCNPIT